MLRIWFRPPAVSRCLLNLQWIDYYSTLSVKYFFGTVKVIHFLYLRKQCLLFLSISVLDKAWSLKKEMSLHQEVFLAWKEIKSFSFFFLGGWLQLYRFYDMQFQQIWTWSFITNPEEIRGVGNFRCSIFFPDSTYEKLILESQSIFSHIAFNLVLKLPVNVVMIIPCWIFIYVAELLKYYGIRSESLCYPKDGQWNMMKKLCHEQLNNH